MLKEFKSKKKTSTLNIGQIKRLFEKGEFKQAHRYCKQMGYQLDDFSDSLKKMGRTMFHSRPGELLSLIHKYGIDVGCETRSILRSLLNQNDYHGFLKNVDRFKMHNDFRSEVEEAISNLKRPEEAQAWRTKFKKMSA